MGIVIVGLVREEANRDALEVVMLETAEIVPPPPMVEPVRELPVEPEPVIVEPVVPEPPPLVAEVKPEPPPRRRARCPSRFASSPRSRRSSRRRSSESSARCASCGSRWRGRGSRSRPWRLRGRARSRCLRSNAWRGPRSGPRPGSRREWTPRPLPRSTFRMRRPPSARSASRLPGRRLRPEVGRSPALPRPGSVGSGPGCPAGSQRPDAG